MLKKYMLYLCAVFGVLQHSDGQNDSFIDKVALGFGVSLPVLNFDKNPVTEVTKANIGAYTQLKVAKNINTRHLVELGLNVNKFSQEYIFSAQFSMGIPYRINATSDHLLFSVPVNYFFRLTPKSKFDLSIGGGYSLNVDIPQNKKVIINSGPFVFEQNEALSFERFKHGVHAGLRASYKVSESIFVELDALYLLTLSKDYFPEFDTEYTRDLLMVGVGLGYML